MHNEIRIVGLVEMRKRLSSVLKNDNEQIDNFCFSDKKMEKKLKFKKNKYIKGSDLPVYSYDLDNLKYFETIEIFGDITITRRYEKSVVVYPSHYLSEEIKKFKDA